MNFLSFFNTIDPLILSECRQEYKKYYNALGIMMIIILILTIIGISSILVQIGLNTLLSIFGGFFFAFFFLMYYRLNIISISSVASQHEDQEQMPRNEFLFRDVVKFVPITIFSWFVSSGLMTLIYGEKLAIIGRALGMKNLGWFSNYTLLKEGLENFEFWLFNIAVFVMFSLPLFCFYYIREIRNGQYNYLNNNYQNSLILTQYNYCMDAYETILRDKAGVMLRKNFNPEKSFLQNPYTEKAVDINGEYSVPLIMADKIETKIAEEIHCTICGNLGNESPENGICVSCYELTGINEHDLDELCNKVYEFMNAKYGINSKIIAKFKDIPVIENTGWEKYLKCKVEYFMNTIYYVDEVYSKGQIQETLVKLYTYQFQNDDKNILGLALKNSYDYFQNTKQFNEVLRLYTYVSEVRNDETSSFFIITKEQ